MYSPYHTNEIKRLYPHRTITIHVKEAKNHLQELIEKKVTDIDTLCKKSTIGQIKHNYLLNINEFDILDILKELTTE